MLKVDRRETPTEAGTTAASPNSMSHPQGKCASKNTNCHNSGGVGSAAVAAALLFIKPMVKR